VVRIVTIEEMESLKASKESSPASGEVPTGFKPEAFYTSVVGRPANVTYKIGVLQHDDEQNKTYVPHMNEARLAPLYMIIHVHTSTFSDPRSPRTRDGHPKVVMALRKSDSTV